jgi:tRNA (guanine-N7-)-methyltransferase
LPIYRGEGIARTDLEEGTVRTLAAALPPPLFNAERRLQALEKLEGRE